MTSHHLSPLRYPGGKARLAPLVKAIIDQNSLRDGCYIEPFAGGFGIGLDLLLKGYVRNVHINDLSPEIYAFWHSALNRTDEFCQLIKQADLSVEEWKRQKEIFSSDKIDDLLERGFATFYLNRTNRSGVLNGGPIGGLDQSGAYKIDARFNRDDLIRRIKTIERVKTRIKLTNFDAIKLIDLFVPTKKRCLFYFDPPYFIQGGNLYYNYYKESDHKNLVQAISKKLKSTHWLVSYDDHPVIREIYSKFGMTQYDLNYSLRARKVGREVMFFSNITKLPELVSVNSYEPASV